LELKRRIKYYCLRFVRLKGEPHELALGMSFGIFSGMLPTIPFHMALSVAVAIFFKGSKITAALGTWVSNPLDWAVLYYLNYKIGAVILGISGDNNVISSIMEAIRQGGEGFAVAEKILGASSTIIAAFLIGGLIMGVVAAVPSYFIFLKLFRVIRIWREKRKERKQWRRFDQ